MKRFTLKLKRMMYISGSFSRIAFLLIFLAVLGKVSAQEVSGEETAKQEDSTQDTLRTFGPRFGIDLAPFIYYFTEPRLIGAEVSVDFEIYKNLYPVDIAFTLEGLYDGFWLNILMYPGEFTRFDALKRIQEYLSQTFPDHF